MSGGWETLDKTVIAGDGVPGTTVTLPRSAAAADRLDLSALWTIFRRRIRVFFYTAIIIFDIAALLAVYLPRYYTATSVVVLNLSDAPIAPTSTKDKPDTPDSSSDVETEMAIITSRDIASRVVDYLHLEDDTDLRQQLMSGGLMGMLGLGKPVPKGPLIPSDRAKLRALIIGWMATSLDVERVSSAYAFSVAFSDTMQSAQLRSPTRSRISIRKSRSDTKPRKMRRPQRCSARGSRCCASRRRTISTRSRNTGSTTIS